MSRKTARIACYMKGRKSNKNYKGRDNRFAGELDKKQMLDVGSVPFFAFFSYIALIWLAELVDVLCFALGFRQVTVISRIVIITFWISALAFLLLKRKIRFEKNNCRKICILISICIFTFGFIKGMMPDLSYDTGNYHLLAQNPGFVNWFKEGGFAAGHFQIWGFRLSDRIVYPFRILLGYRMGTLFSSTVLIISYLQIVQLLKGMRDDFGFGEKARCRMLMPEIFAGFIILGQDCLTALGSYYVDVNAFPIALEVLRLMLKAGKGKVERNEIVYFAWLNGFWFAFKMTNIVFCIPAVVIFVLSVRKIDIRTFLLSVAGCVVPCLIYVFYNFICTKNPVFPYFNEIFASPYFGISNFKDARWGGRNLFEKIFWLFYAVFLPDYRQCEISNPCTVLYAGGLISSILLIRKALLHKIRKEQKGKFCYWELICFTAISSGLWGVTTGIQRYYSFGMLVLSMTCYNGICCLYAVLQKKWVVYLVLFGFAANVCYQSFLVLNGREWAWRKVTVQAVEENVKYLLQDREGRVPQQIKDVEVFVITHHQLCGFAHWLNPKADIFNLSYEGCLEDGERLEFEQKKEEVLKGKAYDLVRAGYDKEAYNSLLDESGLLLRSEEKLETSIGDFVLIELEKAEAFLHN